MNPEIFGALVRIGLCKITASEDEAQRALQKFFASTGSPVPATEDEQLKALSAYLSKQEAKPAAQPAQDLHREIVAAVRIASGIPDSEKMSLVDELIKTPNISMASALERISDRATQLSAQGTATVIKPLAAERDKFVKAARTAVLTRAFGAQSPEAVYNFRTGEYDEFKPAARSYGLQSLPSLAKECLVRDGIEPHLLDRLSPSQIAQFALGLTSASSLGISAASDGPAYNTTGTFANLLLDASNVMLRRSYDDAQTTFQVWMRQAESLPDFKTVSKVIGGEFSDPRAVPEDGAFEEGTFTDAKEAYKLTVWGQVFSITWQAIVNDQLGAFTEVPARLGRSMKRKQNRLAYSVLKDNAAMADTGLLFNATAWTTAGGHGNLTTGAGAPAVATLNTACKQMMEQRGLNTAGPALNLMPRWIISCPALRGTILSLINSTADPAVGGSAAGSSGVANIWENALSVIIDAELGASSTSGSDTAWYLACDWRDNDTIEYAYLQGLETPIIEQQAAFDRLAVRQRIYQAFAVKAIDWRGLYKHAGA